MVSKNWLPHPRFYQINTWTWLQALSQKYQYPITLANIPDEAWDERLRYFDAVWLMGVWERSPIGQHIAVTHAGLQAEYAHSLPDFTAEDVVGSPYSVRQYVVDARLGGDEGLAIARQQLAERGLKLILDFVPNHVAPDHPWTVENPACLIQGNKRDLNGKPGHFFAANGYIFANGRDPYFDPWSDTAQVNAFSPSYRQEALHTLWKIAEQCDGVRCDMAMLLTDDIFARTWGKRAGNPLSQEFWQELIPRVKAKYADFLFMAEVYWQMEFDLIQQGFDYCYDKRLYDRLRDETAESVRVHLHTTQDFIKNLVHFIENHDEKRAAVTFGDRSKASATIALTLPGASLIHEGQMDGHQVKLPVQLGRRPVETDHPDVLEFYERFLPFLEKCQGKWQLCDVDPAIDDSHLHLLAHVWHTEEHMMAVVVNFSPQPASGRILLEQVPAQWQYIDLLTGRTALYPGNAPVELGLDFPAWGACILVS